MVQEELGGFRPPEELNNGMDYETIIYELVKKKGCCYPAEIRRETGFSKDTIYFHLFQLVKQEKLVKHNIAGLFVVPGWLKPRIKELWDMNIKGDRIKGMAWYTLPGAVDIAGKDEVQRDKEHRKKITKIDGEMNIRRGVEPTAEQKEAMKEGSD